MRLEGSGVPACRWQVVPLATHRGVGHQCPHRADLQPAHQTYHCSNDGELIRCLLTTRRIAVTAQGLQVGLLEALSLLLLGEPDEKGCSWLRKVQRTGCYVFFFLISLFLLSFYLFLLPAILLNLSIGTNPTLVDLLHNVTLTILLGRNESGECFSCNQ